MIGNDVPQPVHLSLVIPAYNEAERIGSTLERVLSFLDQQAFRSEVVVVDDGSRDNTRGVVGRFLEHSPTRVRILDYPKNQGKGHAVRVGMTAATGAYRVFYDADGSTPIEELDRLWPAFQNGAQVAIGSRSIPGANVEVHQAWYRETMGKTFNLLLRTAGLTRFRDTQCGFKGFTARACDVIFPRQTIMRYSFDAELLYIAQKHGLPIAEVPIHWVNSPHSRVHPIFDAARMVWDLLLIRWYGLRGRYS